ncbi:hypothetical protein IH824_13260 [candidate division KSB1 bacterium]|nr:hypothetical protein [candidate division KSB1 bacterium]
MKRYAAPVLVALVAVLGVVIVIQAAYLSRLERKITQIERDLHKVVARAPVENRSVARNEEPERSLISRSCA